ncbi:hypothetical protein FNAPI_8527 [Fusarium napiforme]|uniref:Uncharacterized protein n=1 Tax=Fusarium napiforme TaxID=42672 RepID=A0A8H5J242_9HYPO|nr:hypothetical protein FNAPI_8527 [Fusarium napiforme]
MSIKPTSYSGQGEDGQSASDKTVTRIYPNSEIEDIRERLEENRQQLQGYRNTNPDVKEAVTAAKKKADGGATAKGEDQRRSAEVGGRPKMCIGHGHPDTRAAPICETKSWSGD